MHLRANYDALCIHEFCVQRMPLHIAHALGFEPEPRGLFREAENPVQRGTYREKVGLQPVECAYSPHHPTLNSFPNRPH